MLKKVISGGQTGIDQLGLLAAKELGIPTGGTAPKGYLTELGPMVSLLKDDYGLKESESARYGPRTMDNVKDSDATVLFGDMQSPGSAQTIAFCVQVGKNYLCNPTADELRRWLSINSVRTLNVAGNRGSKLSMMAQDAILNTIREALKSLTS